jgi:hypothetical protein
MAEKFKYGPLIYNSIADETDEGNYWWSGSPPVAYEAPSGRYRIPIDASGNQCLPGECILHPNCRVEEWESFKLFKVPSLEWCRSWFEENFLIVSDYDVCRYILRWCSYNYGNDFYQWKMNKTINEIIGEIWPDVQI